MRRRLHYTPSQITKNLYTTGSEWMLESKEEYIGPYHSYITGETFTETNWNPKKSKKLIPYVIESELTQQYKQLKTVQTKYKTPNTSLPVITEKDRVAGYIMRYFIKQVNQPKLIEIDSNQYTSWRSNEIDNNVYTAYEIQWAITGNINTTYKNGVLTKGVVEKNVESIRRLEASIPEIVSILTNPVQYYSDTDFVVPKDING
jgi:hypothetical protein